MSDWPASPLVYAINTWVWLNDLSRKYGRPITLGRVPEADLEQLANCHFNAVWMMGVWRRSPEGRKAAQQNTGLQAAYHGALSDYVPDDVVGSPYAVCAYEVDPTLGGDEELTALRQQLRERFDLRLILDYVPNHLAIDHPWLIAHPEYFVQGNPADLQDQPRNYFASQVDNQWRVFAHGRDPYFDGWTDTVQLDYRSSAVRRAMCDVLLDVARRCDGVRCDLAMLVTHDVFLRTWGGSFDPPGVEFWSAAITEVKSLYPNFLLLAEVYWYLEYMLHQQGFDYTYDKLLYDKLVSRDIAGVRHHLSATDTSFQRHLARFVENHDEERAASLFGPHLSKTVAVLACTLPGMRLLHMGQIQGWRTRLPVQLSRRPQEESNTGMEQFYHYLLAAVGDPIFNDGTWRLLEPTSTWEGDSSYLNFVVYLWEYREEQRLVVVNMADESSQCFVPLELPSLAGRSWRLRDLLSDIAYIRDGNELLEPGLFLKIEGGAYHIFQLQFQAESADRDWTVVGEDVPGIVRQRRLLERPKGIYGMAWSPDGQTLAVAGLEKTIWLWDVASRTAVRRFKGHDTIGPVSWSPDGQLLASGSDDKTVRVWSVESNALHLELRGHYDHVLSVAWSPDGKILVSGSVDRLSLVWDVATGRQIQILYGHSDSVNCVAWSPDGKTLATGSGDQTIRLWDGETYQLRHLLKGDDWVSSLAWSPDSRLLAAGTGGGTIDIWDVETRSRIVCEGHTRRALGVTFSSDGRLLASKANDGTVRLRRCDSWQELAALSEGAEYLMGIAFHPTKPILASRDDHNNTVWLRELDVDAFLHTAGPISAAQYYTNAKVVLLGDTGVGKSGLGLVLCEQAFVPTVSTHGSRALDFDRSEIELPRGGKETRETLLWDLAGQPGYRLIHQLHLNEVAVALVIFDARSETDPFAGVRYWDRALRQAQRVDQSHTTPLRKFLVAARADRGSIPVKRERIDALVHDLDFAGYFETSAKEGWGVDELRSAIQAGIDWNPLPKVHSPEMFRQIKTFLIEEKERGRLLTTVDDLYHTFLRSADNLEETPNLRAQFETCIGRIEARLLIRRLSFGDMVLLQPELLDAYASALIDAARNEPDGFGCINESDARECRFRMPETERLKDRAQEKLLLIAMVEHLLAHEIALHEPPDLIFPSQLTRVHPDLPEPPGKAVVFSFEGPVLNIYATLAVRLSRSGVFEKKELWKNAASYTASVGGTCGMFLREVDEARGELTLFFEADASEQIRLQFEQYVETHLRRRALPESIRRQRIFICSKCGTPVSDIAVMHRRERGFDWIACNVCEEMRISLRDREARLVTIAPSIVMQMDRAADSQRDLEVAESALHGMLETEDSDRYAQGLLVFKQRRLTALRKQQAYYGISTPPEVVMEIDDLQREINELGKKSTNYFR